MHAMNIAFIVDSFPSLSTTFITNQITGLLDRGHEVDIYSRLPGDLEKVHPDIGRYRLLERARYAPQLPQNYLYRAIKAAYLIARHGWKEPVAILRALNVRKYRRQATSLRLLFETVPMFKSRPYDVIHAQFGPLGLMAMELRELGVLTGKLVTHFRGYDVSSYLRHEGNGVYETLWKRGDLFLANCDFFRNRALELGCPPEKILVQRSGIDCQAFSFKDRYPPSDGIVQIATVGRLTEKKGIEFGIRAVAQLIQCGARINYQIIGEGPLRPNIEHLIEDLGLTENIKLLGRKNQTEIIHLLGDVHIFMAPSVTSAQGDQDAPVNTLKEAMAMGLPVVATWHGGIPELVEDGISGFLVPERDAHAITDRLEDLISHPDKWLEMGRAGRARVEADYDINKLNDQLVELYRRIAVE